MTYDNNEERPQETFWGGQSNTSGESVRVDMSMAISRALSDLPDRQRLVFVLKEIEGFKYTEISEILGLPVGTVKSLTYRAVKRLQRNLQAYDPQKFQLLREC